MVGLVVGLLDKANSSNSSSSRAPHIAPCQQEDQQKACATRHSNSKLHSSLQLGLVFYLMLPLRRAIWIEFCALPPPETQGRGRAKVRGEGGKRARSTMQSRSVSDSSVHSCRCCCCCKHFQKSSSSLSLSLSLSLSPSVAAAPPQKPKIY